LTLRERSGERGSFQLAAGRQAGVLRAVGVKQQRQRLIGMARKQDVIEQCLIARLQPHLNLAAHPAHACDRGTRFDGLAEQFCRCCHINATAAFDRAPQRALGVQ